MPIWLRIAGRYIFFKKKRNFINILTILSVVGVAVGTAALVIVLSAFNGLQGVVRDMFVSFDPELKIEAIEGKSFPISKGMIDSLKAIDNIAYVAEVIEDNALIRYNDVQMITRFRGVDANYQKQRSFNRYLSNGSFSLGSVEMPRMVLGSGVARTLNTDPDNPFNTLQLWYPSKKKAISANPESAFEKVTFTEAGQFNIDQQTDDRIVYISLDVAEELIQRKGKRSYIEVKTKNIKQLNATKADCAKVLGPNFKVLDSDEQHSALIRVLRIEKFFVFLALGFILLIASFNIYVSLGMMAVEKQRDAALLFALGALPDMLTKIYLSLGAIIALGGALVGMVIGYGICFAQQVFGIVKMGLESSIVDAYPVEMQLADFLAISATIIVITLLSGLPPALKVSKSDIKPAGVFR